MDATDQSRLLYSPNAAARALDISRSLIYAWMKSGQLRFVKVGADRRIPADEIKRVAAEGIPPKAGTESLV